MELQEIHLQKIKAGHIFPSEDVVAVEAQYRVFVGGAPAFSFTCTPRDVEEMVTGALYSRKYIQEAAQVEALQISGGDISVTLGKPVGDGRHGPHSRPILEPDTMFRVMDAIFNDPDTLFSRTGCAHRCALMHGGEILCAFEDIGRHNALDKVIGHALRRGIPMEECVIFTSGRIPGDYMAKIIHAGFPVAVSRSAVTDEAVRLARAHNVTLYGFVRGSSANLYNP